MRSAIHWLELYKRYGRKLAYTTLRLEKEKGKKMFSMCSERRNMRTKGSKLKLFLCPLFIYCNCRNIVWTLSCVQNAKGCPSQAQGWDLRSVHRERMSCSVACLTHCPHHYTQSTCETSASTQTVRRAMLRHRWITWLTRKNRLVKVKNKYIKSLYNFCGIQPSSILFASNHHLFYDSCLLASYFFHYKIIKDG